MNKNENLGYPDSIWETLLEKKIANIKQKDEQIEAPEEIFKLINEYLSKKLPKDQYEYKTSNSCTPFIEQFTSELKIYCPQNHYFGIKNMYWYNKKQPDVIIASPFTIYHTSKNTGDCWVQIYLDFTNTIEVLNEILDIINNFESYLKISIKQEEERKKYLEKQKDFEKQINDVLNVKFRNHKYCNKNLNIFTNDDLLISFNKKNAIITNFNDINNFEIKIPAFSAIMALHSCIDSIEIEYKDEENND